MKRFLVAVVLGVFSIATNAELIDRGGGFLYDDVLNITWTQNANINGLDTWENQVAWADSLSLFDSVRNVTWNDWRLPSMDVDGGGTPAPVEEVVWCPPGRAETVSELACRDNEYGYLNVYYGITPGSTGLFTNFMFNHRYWSSTEHAPDLSDAWSYVFFTGSQGFGDKSILRYALAVRDGDVIPLEGDINGDGLVNVADLLLLQRALIELITLDAEQTLKADVYPNGGDGVLSIGDLMVLLSLMLAP